MLTVTYAQLKAVAPLGNATTIDAIASRSGEVFAKYGLTSLNRVWGFLSVVVEETGGLRVLSEDLNYTAQRAADVWPTRFHGAVEAVPYAHNPKLLADRVYGGRMGNTGPDDGWNFRGQGLLQITGRDNFALLERLTGLPVLAQPGIVTDPAHLLECAVALFVQYPGILEFCDKGDWHAVWALVGSGRATGPLINLAAHEAALKVVQRGVPVLVDVAPVAVKATTWGWVIVAAAALVAAGVAAWVYLR